MTHENTSHADRPVWHTVDGDGCPGELEVDRELGCGLAIMFSDGTTFSSSSTSTGQPCCNRLYSHNGCQNMMATTSTTYLIRFGGDVVDVVDDDVDDDDVDDDDDIVVFDDDNDDDDDDDDDVVDVIAINMSLSFDDSFFHASPK